MIRFHILHFATFLLIPFLILFIASQFPVTYFLFLIFFISAEFNDAYFFNSLDKNKNTKRGYYSVMMAFNDSTVQFRDIWVSNAEDKVSLYFSTSKSDKTVMYEYHSVGIISHISVIALSLHCNLYIQFLLKTFSPVTEIKIKETQCATIIIYSTIKEIPLLCESSLYIHKSLRNLLHII